MLINGTCVNERLATHLGNGVPYMALSSAAILSGIIGAAILRCDDRQDEIETVSLRTRHITVVNGDFRRFMGACLIGIAVLLCAATGIVFLFDTSAYKDVKSVLEGCRI